MTDPGSERLLAIDYGEKRIGLALTDPLMLFAYPYDTLPNDGKFFEKLKKLIAEKEVTKILLGYPLKESGEKYKLTEKVLKFKQQLEKLFRLEVILRDERYSSSIAMERIMESVPGKKKRRDKSLIDKNAAAVILEDYLRELK